MGLKSKCLFQRNNFNISVIIAFFVVRLLSYRSRTPHTTHRAVEHTMNTESVLLFPSSHACPIKTIM